MRALSSFFLVCLMVFSLAACGMSSSSPEAVAKQYVEAGLAGDVDTMMELLYFSDDDRDTEGVEDIIRGKLTMSVAGMKQKVEAKGGVDSVTVEDANIREGDSGKRARVKVLVQYGNESDPSGEWVNLRQTDNGWKVELNMF